MELKHTPGPWKASITDPPGDFVIHARGIPQQLAYLAKSTVFDFPIDANAALIAASPDLLEVAIWAEAVLAPFSKKPAEKSGISKLRAAIAKATGAS